MDKLRIPLNYGSLAGICYFGMFLLFYLLGKNPLLEMGFWFTFWIPILFIYFSIKKTRDEVQNGFITYGSALGKGLLTTLVYSSLYAILIYLFVVFVDASLMDGVVAESLRVLEEKGETIRNFMGEEAFDQMLEETENTSVGSLSMGQFIGNLIGGLVISLIMAAILKRNPSPFDEETVTDEQ